MGPRWLHTKLIRLVPTFALLAGGIIASCSGAITSGDEAVDSSVTDPGQPTAGAGGSGALGSGGASGRGGASVAVGGTAQGSSGSNKAGAGGAGTGSGGTTGSAGRGGAAGSMGVAGSAGGGGSSGMPVGCTNDTMLRSGHATWYTATTQYPACGVAYAALPKNYGAMNEDDYRGSAACGTCARVQAQGKTLDVEIGDLCPYQGNAQWCFPGSHHIDLSPDAFAFFADKNMGVLTIQWKYVPCVVTGGVAYTFKAESSAYWAEVLVSNYPYEITKLEFLNKQGTYQSVPRMSYNYFQAQSGMGAGPFTLRVTDIHGSVVQDTVPLMPGGTHHALDNFGLCKM